MAALAACAFVLGAGEVLIDGGLPALTRDTVRSDQLEVANARLVATETVNNQFVGPPVGAILFEIAPSLPLFVIGALFLTGSGLLTQLTGAFQARRSESARPERFRDAVTVGLRYVWTHRVLRPLALSVALFAFVSEAGNAGRSHRPHQSLLEHAVLDRDLHAGLAPSRFVDGRGRRVRRRRRRRPLRTVVERGEWHGSPTARPDEVFGRTITAYLFIAWSMQPLGAVTGGVVAQRWGAEWVFLLSAFAVGSLFFLARPMFRALDTAMAKTGADER